MKSKSSGSTPTGPSAADRLSCESGLSCLVVAHQPVDAVHLVESLLDGRRHGWRLRTRRCRRRRPSTRGWPRSESGAGIGRPRQGRAATPGTARVTSSGESAMERHRPIVQETTAGGPPTWYLWPPCAYRRWSFACALAARAALAQTPDVGRRTYESRCSRCHGADGNGGELAPAIAGAPAPSHRRPALDASFATGLPSSGMPGATLAERREARAPDLPAHPETAARRTARPRQGRDHGGHGPRGARPQPDLVRHAAPDRRQAHTPAAGRWESVTGP